MLTGTKETQVVGERGGAAAHAGARERTMEPVFSIDSPAFSSDEFRMYEFKVKRCPRIKAHDWTECPFAHPGEKARRRDPRKYSYSGTACPDFRKGSCKRGDACEFAHGVFECWLHPSRYRTQTCTDGEACKRRVCFFAHNQGEIRVPTECPVATTPPPHAAAGLAGLAGAKGHPAAGLAALAGSQDPAALQAAVAQILSLQAQQQFVAQMAGFPGGVPALPGVSPLLLQQQQQQLGQMLKTLQMQQAQQLSGAQAAAAGAPGSAPPVAPLLAAGAPMGAPSNGQHQAQAAAYFAAALGGGAAAGKANGPPGGGLNGLNGLAHGGLGGLDGRGAQPFYPGKSPPQSYPLSASLGSSVGHSQRGYEPPAGEEAGHFKDLAHTMQDMKLHGAGNADALQAQLAHSMGQRISSVENLLSSLPRSLSDLGLNELTKPGANGNGAGTGGGAPKGGNMGSAGGHSGGWPVNQTAG